MTGWDDRASEHDPDTGPRFHRVIPEPASLGFPDSPENAPLSLPCDACGEDHAPNERCSEVVPATGGYSAKLRGELIELRRENAVLLTNIADQGREIAMLRRRLGKIPELERVIVDLHHRLAQMISERDEALAYKIEHETGTRYRKVDTPRGSYIAWDEDVSA